MLADDAPSEVTGGCPPLELRIHAQGTLDDALIAELGGLTVRPVPGGAVLQGPVVDAAELWGVLHRLHRAQLKIRSVERLGQSSPHQAPTTPQESDAARRDDVLVRIEVDGYAAGLMSAMVESAEVYQSPPSTTLVMRVPGEDVLFDVLDVLEDLALELRGIRVVD